MGAFSGLRSRAALIAAGFAALALSGCPVDQRALGSGPQSLGSASGGAAGDGAADGFDTSGEGGGAAAGVIGSWSFDRDVGEWQAEGSVEQTWDAVDADGRASSGSLVLTNAGSGSGDGSYARGSSVCLSVESGVTYDISAKLRIDPGQSTGGGGFFVSFFNVAGCEGRELASTNYLSVTTDAWLLAQRSQQAPPETQSALFRLYATKLQSDPPFSVRFDDVRFRAR